MVFRRLFLDSGERKPAERGFVQRSKACAVFPLAVDQTETEKSGERQIYLIDRDAGLPGQPAAIGVKAPVA